MKLKDYNTFTSKNQAKGKSSVRVNRKSGVIAFSAKASQKMGLSEIRYVMFHQDETRPRDWYVSVSDHKSGGFSLRRNSNTRSVLFNSSHLANSILDSVGITANSAIMMIAKETEIDGKILWPIITSAAKL